MTESLPPHDREAEAATIGGVMIDESAIKTIDLQPEDFYILRHRWIWEAMVTLSNDQQPIDYITISSELTRMGADVEPGFLTHLMNECVSSMNVNAYAKTVKDFSAKRQMLQVFNLGAGQCYNGKAPDEIMSSVSNELGKIGIANKADEHTYTAGTATKNAINAIEMASNGVRTFAFDISPLDGLLWLSKGDLLIIGGRPGTGKTVLLMTGIANNPSKRGMLFEMETGHEQATIRILSQLSNVPAYRMLRGQMGDDDYAPLYDSVANFETWDTVICDLPAMRLSQIRQRARKEHAKKPLDYIMVDYLQLANGDGKQESRAREVGQVAQGLKELAKELDIPIIAAAQINRGSELVSEKRPALHNLKESGDIEQAADSVVFVHINDSGGRTLIVAKQRMGKLGDVDVYFNEGIMRFENCNTQNVNTRDWTNKD